MNTKNRKRFRTGLVYKLAAAWLLFSIMAAASPQLAVAIGESAENAIPVAQFDRLSSFPFSGNPVWYSFELIRGQGIVATLKASIDSGSYRSVNMTIYDRTSHKLQNTVSISDGKTEKIRHTAALGGNYYIKVSGNSSTKGFYDFGIFNAWFTPGTKDSDRTVFRDAFTSRHIENGNFALSPYGHEAYRFLVPDDSDYSVSVTARLGGGRLIAHMYDQHLNKISETGYIYNENTRILSGHRTVGGVSYLYISQYDGATGSYDLSVSANLISNADSDSDGLFDDQESHHGTDPLDSDTDGDSASDFDEISRGEDPLHDYEPIDSSEASGLAAAMPLPGRDRFFNTDYPGTETWYCADLIAGEGVLVALTAHVNKGKLYFRLYDSRQNAIETSDSAYNGDTATVSYTPTVGGRFYAKVYAADGAYGDYDIALFNAWFNPGTTDDQRAFFSRFYTAKSIRSGNFATNGYDDVRYRFYVPDDSAYSISIAAHLGAGYLYGEIWDQRFARLQTGSRLYNGNNQTLTGHATIGGVYYLRIVQADGAYGHYDLSVSPGLDDNLDSDSDGLFDDQESHHGTDPLDSDTDGDSKSDFDEISTGEDPLHDYEKIDSSEASGFAAAMPLPGRDRFFNTEYPGTETWYCADLIAGEGVLVALTAHVNKGKLYFRLYDSRQNAIETSDSACNGDTATVSYTPTVGGRFYAKVYAADGAYGNYDIALFNAWFNPGTTDDQRAFFSRFYTAKSIRSGNFATNGYGDARYRFYVPNDSDFSISISAHLGAGYLYGEIWDRRFAELKTGSRLYNGNNQTLTGHATIGGVYYLRVVQADGAYGHYDLSVSPGLDDNLDSDSDGLFDDQESHHGTDPLNPDTDADSKSDFDEIAAGGSSLADYEFIDSSEGSSAATALEIFDYERFFTTEYRGAETWYSMFLYPDQGITVALTAHTNRGAFVVTVYDANGESIGYTDKIYNGETETFSFVPLMGGPYYVKVKDYNGGYGRYDIGIFEAWFNPGCPEDERDFQHTLFTAKEAQDKSYSISDLGDSYFRFEAQTEEKITVGITPLIGRGNLEAILYDEEGKYIKKVDNIYNGVEKAISHVAQAYGTYYLRIRAENDAFGSFDLRVVPDETVTARAELLSSPAQVTTDADAIFTIGGKDVAFYRYKIDNGEFSSALPVSEKILLRDLSLGVHVLQLLGQREAGDWQTVPTQFEWEIRQSYSNEFPKAIVIVGSEGGESALQDGLRWNGNYAAKVLMLQGYSRDRLCYLTDGDVPDLDENGFYDDKDGAATLANIERAITEWPLDASELNIYILGHGGYGSFRVNEREILKATDLDSWLDKLQDTIPGHVLLIYDACQSGSFTKELIAPEGKQRIVVSSAEEDEPALFADTGTVSFSLFFWGRLGAGDSFYEAYYHANNSIRLVTNHRQKPGIDADGNGVTGEKADWEAIRSARIGNRVSRLSGVPSVGGITPSQTVGRGGTVVLFAQDVVDEDGIGTVTATITPPGAWDGASDIPVSDLPSVELLPVGNGRYEAVYKDFQMEGNYGVAIIAEDSKGTLSVPHVATITVEEDAASESGTLYFPFALSNGDWETEIGVVNTSPDSRLEAVFAVYDQYGKAVGFPVNVDLNPLGRKLLTVGSDFANPEQVRYATLETDSVHAAGFQRLRRAETWRAALPAAKRSGSETLYVSHVASSQAWQTMFGLVNTNDTARNVEIEFNDGSIETIALGPKECAQFSVKDLFGGVPLENASTAELRNADGVVGLELFCDGKRAAGLPLNDKLSDLIYYPHIASDSTWDTGLVAYNTGTATCRLIVTPYRESGATLPARIVDIAPKGRYFGVVSALGLPDAAAWLKIKAASPVTGFELFATKDGWQMAGYEGLDLAKKQGVLPFLESDGATGFAAVNVGSDAGTLKVSAYNNAGFLVDEVQFQLEPLQKRVSPIDKLFDGGISGARYLRYECDSKVVAFQLNMSSNKRMLDALQGLWP